MNKCIIGVGSNMEAKYHIQEAIRLLSEDVDVTGVSQMLTTKPIGIIDQPDFTNGAVLIETDMDMDVFSGYLKNMEDRMGRDRSQKKFGPRNIDLDILVWNGTIVDPDYHTREYLRILAAELGFENNNETEK